LKLESTKKKLLVRPQHRQNNNKEVRYEGENLILAHNRVQWQALIEYRNDPSCSTKGGNLLNR